MGLLLPMLCFCPCAKIDLVTLSQMPHHLCSFACHSVNGRAFVSFLLQYNFSLDPSLTLGCGSWGSTSVSNNVGPRHLLNIKNVTERRENMLWFRVPPKVYFKVGCLDVALRDLAGCQRAFIVTDKPLHDMGYTHRVTSTLDELNIQSQVCDACMLGPW